MAVDELIKLARRCGDRDAKCKTCPFGQTQDCTIQLLNALADALEELKEDAGISCNTCARRSKSFKEPPCSECNSLHSKWTWRGNVD